MTGDCGCDLLRPDTELCSVALNLNLDTPARVNSIQNLIPLSYQSLTNHLYVPNSPISTHHRDNLTSFGRNSIPDKERQ